MSLPGSTVLKSSMAGILNFLYPWRCEICHSDDPAKRNDLFCVDCQAELTRELTNSCQKCGAEVGPFVSTTNGCVHCRNRSFRFDSVTCLGMYDETMRRAILSSKWSHSAVALESLARLLAAAKHTELHELGIDIIIPIPQSWRTRLTRAFNSATTIAEQLTRPAEARVDQHILFRKGRTRPQKRVALQNRYANQEDSFRVQDVSVIKAKNVLLVDDVMTTGATCTEAATVLKKNGAAKVHVAVVARVLTPR